MENNNEEQKIWITVSETINKGNYESIKIEAGFSKTYTKENPIKLIDNGIDILRSTIKKKTKLIRKKERSKK